MENLKKRTITTEDIETFLNGHDPQERIVNLEYSYKDNFVKVYYRNENDQKCVSMQPFYPFLWARLSACLSLCNGDRKALKALMKRYKIGVKELSITNNDGVECEEMRDGYRYKFYALEPMSYSTFLDFFKKANFPVYQDKDTKVEKRMDRPYISITPQEQYLISTGKRFFKGYDDYNQLLRMIFDLETEGLDPKKDRIKLNGIRLNRPIYIDGVKYDKFEKIFRLKGKTKEELDASELKVIDTMFRIIYTVKPDIITAHNGENFDWAFIIERCNQLGTTIQDVTKPYFKGASVYKNPKESVLKLGGEVETFHQTIVPGVVITDSLHAVRRAQATDSNFLKADLKYSTKYLEMVKPNRVYVPGDIIDKTLCDLVKHYAFNDENGDWYLYDPDYVEPENIVKSEKNKTDKFVLLTHNTLLDGYELVSGKYIVERYLLDDLWECDKVEANLNQSAFSICKVLPLPFQKCCTMGTAGQWKSLMMAWSYENDLAIPYAQNTGKFTGGLSRLLSTGFVDNVAKFDFNSLYPAIELTWGIEDEKDISSANLIFLNYFLTSRETFKKEKKKADKIIEKYEKQINGGTKLNKEQEEEYHKALANFAKYDKLQNNRKIFCNTNFGSLSSNSGSVYPWKSLKCGERITCTGRQSLRLMISYFTNLGYKPIVGDSFTEDTPLFIKYKDNGFIDIKPICKLINETEIQVDELGREYDYSVKPYYVLCRSGWIEPKYIYRHKTDKNIYEITDGDMKVEVTEDHSLFNSKQEKIKPSEIDENTKLEYYNNEVNPEEIYSFDTKLAYSFGKTLAYGFFRRVPFQILNASSEIKKEFYRGFMENYKEDFEYSKTCIAGLQFIKKIIG